ncbi:RES family NAD+ phosphorylase [Cupriavidus oxalaticus]|uniref:RES domain-containing protein n=1 Tax=Cupriavidus oxalaticus TaxID=96344 RepID=A0A5P3VRA2_9BURK|nr:RES domain-containing protein [Cupriavidus oxalaticus]QEZ48677.1 RES domain-containing protein [Cupriavidus oxalaticus]
MQIFRIADQRHEVWNGTGAMLVGGRFNSPGRPLIYGTLTFAGAMLEVLVHARIGKVPRHHALMIGSVSDDISVERAEVAQLPTGWDTLEDPRAARSFGDRWLAEGRSAILLVPSVVARLEWNALVNPVHPDASRIQVAAPEPVQWDDRLFH